MASEVIKLNLIPKGEMPVFHASQFDTGRLITCELYRGEDAYDVPAGYTVELHCRKVDNNIVTMASTLVNGNVVTFTSTEQLTACNGKNLCEVAILDEGYRIGTLNFILEVEVDPLKGGINSTSEIHNLETQIEEITTEVIGENYYNKTEVDDLLDTKADADSVYTIGEVNTLLSGKANAADVYTKSQTDTLLSAKANSSDVYTKGQVDTALSVKADTTYVDAEVDNLEAAINIKADASSVYTKTETDTKLALKANAADVYTKQEVDNIIMDIMPVDTASGPIATFDTEIAAPLVNVSCNIVATGGYDADTQTAHPINGYTEANITANSNTYTIAFGQTVYGGVLDVTRGKLRVDRSITLVTETSLLNKDTDHNSYHRFFFRKDDVVKQTDYVGHIIASACPVVNSYTYFGGFDGEMAVTAYSVASRPENYLYIISKSLSTVAEVQAQFAEEPLQIVYELATPFDIDLTPEVISAVVGTNNVYSDTNGDTTVKFRDSIQHYIDNH